ncbi:hypothetical protein OSH11_23320 [Kaistia dalseonensis]|uniref:Uncharacterized protein n=1 Tax=Kaistia dalseonensis TaxID=410840 RepID=A0ABU0HEX0_9HYPH|nr:hypothetical protein [Kaistia dalseonensis]MCX5497648.1 hypothetical protein [Kaistia dalseonensis]MDQ0440290.1 hypothetical protein [Kaistia dalseonensis]
MADDEVSADWAAIRADCEAGLLSQRAIAEKHGQTRPTIMKRALAEGWAMPAARPGRRAAHPKPAHRLPDRAALVARLFRSFERQIAALEKRYAGGGAAADEKDARMLAALARTFETLNGLRADEEKEERNHAPVDHDALRAELARRMAALDPAGLGPRGYSDADDPGGG